MGKLEIARSLYDSGKAALQSNRIEEAVDSLNKSAKLSPHFKTLELLGESLIGLGKLNEAIIPLAAATALNRGVRAPSILAQVFLELGDRERARNFASVVLETAPSNKNALRVEHLPEIISV